MINRQLIKKVQVGNNNYSLKKTKMIRQKLISFVDDVFGDYHFKSIQIDDNQYDKEELIMIKWYNWERKKLTNIQ